jgi:hypothetical protein
VLPESARERSGAFLRRGRLHVRRLAPSQSKNKGRKAMPHPKNRLKLTGDTHLPDIGDLLDDADEVEVSIVEVDAQPRVYADGWVPSARDTMPEGKHSLPEPLMAVERTMEQRVVSTPWLAMGAALAFGFLVAKMLRR